MQEVFSKIIERLEELQNYACFPTEWVNEEQSKIHSYYANKLTEILKLTEQYNNGWIPCSERLPEEYTVLCCDKYGEMIIGHPYFDEVSDTNYSAESDNEMMYNCVAWQLLPEPYKK